MTFSDHALGALWAQNPALMGVVNVTPDSFSDGGNFISKNSAVEHALQLFRNGASIIDIGGESTRPGAEPVDLKEEIGRVVPVIAELKGKVPYISIDTRNAATMQAALDAGANIINDISALTDDPESINIVKSSEVPVILMHKQGQPISMQEKPNYNSVVDEIIDFLQERINYCETHRIEKKRLVIDPGIGFGKTLEHNLVILSNIKKFQSLGAPVLLGVSRKSFIGQISSNEPPDERFPGSLAAALYGYQSGVQMFRVHDVAETKQAFKVYQAIKDYGNSGA